VASSTECEGLGTQAVELAENAGRVWGLARTTPGYRHGDAAHHGGTLCIAYRRFTLVSVIHLITELYD
jgi:hypothetical protein